MSCFFHAVTWLVWIPNWHASWAVVRSPLAAARATLALNAAPNTRRFPAIIMLLVGCLPPAELHLIKAPENRGPPQLKAARIPATKLLDEFDFTARPSVNKPQVLELVKGEYLDRQENILLVGPSGTGKTHLATALGTAACSQGRKVRFFRVTDLVTLLLEAKEERHLLRLRQQLAKLGLPILDELGYVPASKAGAELLFDVIATA